MNKTAESRKKNTAFRYTVLAGGLALGFVVFSMLSLRLLFGRWEETLLAKSGQLNFASPVSSLQESTDATEGTDAWTVAGEKRMNIGQMKKIIEAWHRKEFFVIHSPVEGQISIEEAIGAVKSWISEMGIMEGEENTRALIQATLNQSQNSEGTLPHGADYSFWEVVYQRAEMEGVFYVNAVTGNVWEARLELGEAWAEAPDAGYLNKFIELAGVEAKQLKIEELASEEWAACITEDADSSFLATMRYGYEENDLQDSDMQDSEQYEESNSTVVVVCAPRLYISFSFAI